MTEAEFQERLLSILDRKDHAAWKLWTGSGIAPAQLRLHYQQEWLVFVRDFPRFLGLIHGHCPVAEVRRALAANLYEEETGGLSFHRPHPELFLDLMEALGFRRSDFESALPLPAAAAYHAHLEQSAGGPWIVGAAVITLWVEGSVHERQALRDVPEEPIDVKLKEHFLVRHHGLRPEQLTLMRAHAAVEGGHRRDAWTTVLGHAREEATRAAVLDAMETACRLWHAYRHEVTRAAGVAAG